MSYDHELLSKIIHQLIYLQGKQDVRILQKLQICRVKQ